MQREKVIELLQKSGVWSDRDGDAMARSYINLAIEFARLVELETLERAAKKCEDIAYMMGGSVGAMDCALSIRNLKETHDKE